jgi:hypothetical protein
MLLTGSGHVLSGQLPALFQAVAYHQPTVSPSVFSAFVYRKLLAPPPFSGALLEFLPSLLCASFQFIFYSGFLFFLIGGESVQGTMQIYPRGGWGNNT